MPAQPPPPSPHKRKKKCAKKRGVNLELPQLDSWQCQLDISKTTNTKIDDTDSYFSNASIISLTSQWQTDMRKTTKTKINSIDTEAIKRTESSKKNINQSLPKKMLIKRSFTLLLNLLRVEKRTWYKLDISLSLEI